jgi:hypothetical protein
VEGGGAGSSRVSEVRGATGCQWGEGHDRPSCSCSGQGWKGRVLPSGVKDCKVKRDKRQAGVLSISRVSLIHQILTHRHLQLYLVESPCVGPEGLLDRPQRRVRVREAQHVHPGMHEQCWCESCSGC